MRKTATLFVFAALAGAAGFVDWRFHWLHPRQPDAPAARAAEKVSFEEEPQALKAQRRVKFYRNPMGLADTSPTPKKDSMGMDYIPVYADEAGEDASDVALSSGKLQKIGVRSEEVSRRPLATPVHATGRIEFDPRRVSVVALRFEGFIESVDKVAEGDFVRKGQPLMRIYGPTLSSAAADYLVALRSRGAFAASQHVEGTKRRLLNLGLDERAVAALARAGSVPRAMPWPAPQDGHIFERTAVNGMRAAPGDALFRIVDHSVVWVLADVSERDLALIEPGEPAVVRPRAFPGRAFTGRVGLIYPHLNAETRTARVRIELPNPDGLLRGDMFADVEIAAGGTERVTAAPESAVIDTGARQIVLIDKGDGRFEPRAVKVGRHGDGFVEIRNGLGKGDRVVTSANFLIDAESNLKAALRSFDQPEARP